MLEEKEEILWSQNAKDFWNIITSRDEPNHLRYVGKLKGSRTRKSTSKKPLPIGEDIYMSLLPQTVIGKKRENISCFNLLWVDIDFKDYFQALDSGIEYKLLNLREPPNIIIFSGKGYWALWSIEPLSRNEWLLAQRDLVGDIKAKIKVKNMHVDTKVISPLKFIRLPNTTNTKTGQKVSFKVVHNGVKCMRSPRNVASYTDKGNLSSVYDSAERGMNKGLDGNSTNLVANMNLSKTHRVLRLENLYTLNLTRVGDLEKILAWGYIEKGHRNEYLHIYSCQLVMLGKEKDYILEKLKSINISEKWRITLSELRRIASSAIKNKYRYKNGTIIDKLALDTEILSKLDIIKPLDEKKQKEIKNIKDKETKKRNRRNEDGLTKTEQKKKDTINIIQKLKGQGLTQKQVNTQTKIALRTVQRYWNIQYL